MKICRFTDLEAWKEAHKLTLLIYEITGKFPKSELYGLTSQLRRAAVSIESCIAEGFCRFYYEAPRAYAVVSSKPASQAKLVSLFCLPSAAKKHSFMALRPWFSALLIKIV